MQTRGDSSPNSLPWLELRGATVDVLKTSLDFLKPRSLDTLIIRLVEASNQHLRDVRSLPGRKLEGLCENGVPRHVVRRLREKTDS